MALYFCFFFFLISSALACDRCVHQTKVSYFSTASPLSSGACGYGSSAINFNNGQLAASVPTLYKDGAGCGACFQMRCKNTTLCTKEGTRVIVTDLNKNNQTDFVVSSRAFMAMANKGMGKDILKNGIVNVEYKRVPCDYKNKNLAVRVEEKSQKPNYLAIKFMFQGGQTEIVGVDVGPVGSSAKWRYMTRSYGAVWDTSSVGVPRGGLQFRLAVTAGYDAKLVLAKNVLPSNWRAGATFDTGVQITDIAQERCQPCDDGGWK